MVSEARRGLVRISANYTRVITNVFLGLLLAPLLLRGTGNDGWALIALLGSTVGLASMAQEVVRSSLIRELGEAYHDGDAGTFGRVYNSALVISAAIAALATALFVVLWLVVPLLEIPPHLVGAARWLVVTRGAETAAVLLLAAPFNMYKVTERMVAYNTWLVAGRAAYIVGAVWVIFVQPSPDVGRSVTLYAIVSTGVFLAHLVVASAVMIAIDRRRLVPRLRSADTRTVRAILHIGGWNAGATAATMSYRRLAPLLMNLAFGLVGNLVLGIAILLTVSVRRLTVGMTDGLDAVSARLSITRGDGAVRTLMHHAVRLHGLTAFPLVTIVFVLPGVLLDLWLGGRLEDPGTTAPMTITLIRVMTLGMAARAVADGWMRVLYGAGHVVRYAPLVVAGGVAFPLLCGLLLLVLPEPVRFTAVAWAYTGVLVGVHGCGVPLVAARALGIPAWRFYTPLLRPLVISVVCAPILLVAVRRLEAWTWLHLAAVLAAYGVVYGALGVFFVMDRAERHRFAKAAWRRLPIVGG